MALAALRDPSRCLTPRQRAGCGHRGTFATVLLRCLTPVGPDTVGAGCSATRSPRDLRAEPPNLVCGDRTPESLQLELADRLDLARVLDRGEDALADQGLPGSCLHAQPRGEFCPRAERAVVVPALEADAAEGGVAGADSDPETE